MRSTYVKVESVVIQNSFAGDYVGLCGVPSMITGIIGAFNLLQHGCKYTI